MLAGLLANISRAGTATDAGGVSSVIPPPATATATASVGQSATSSLGRWRSSAVWSEPDLLLGTLQAEVAASVCITHCTAPTAFALAGRSAAAEGDITTSSAGAPAARAWGSDDELEFLLLQLAA